MGKANTSSARERSAVQSHRYLELFEKLSPLVGTASVEKITSAACGLIADLLQVEACSILGMDACRNCLVPLSATHIPREEWPSICIPNSVGVCGHVFTTGKPLLLRKAGDFRAFGIEPKSKYGRASCIIVPLFGEGGGVRAVINIANPKRSRSFNERDLETIQAVARLIAAGLEGARKSQEALELNHRLEEILNNLHVGVVALDSDFNITQCNQRFVKMFAPGETPIGRPARSALDSGIFNVCRRLMRELGATQTISQERFEGESKGNKQAIEITALTGNPSCDGPSSYLLMLEDISQGEEVKRLREANSLKRSFLRIISHELRTPLTVLGGAIPLIDMYCGGEANGDPKLVLGKLRQVLKPNVQRLTNVVNTVLDVVDIENGNMKLVLQPLDLNKLVGDRVESLRDAAAVKGLEWNVQLDPELPPVMGDQQRLRQTFYELLDNAMKFSFPKSEMAVRTAIDGGMAGVWIVNKGEPITRERRDEVFEKFYQLDQTMTRRSGGCGLGLYLSRNIAALHGGSLQVIDGEPDETVFLFKLPLAPQAVAAPAVAAPA